MTFRRDSDKSKAWAAWLRKHEAGLLACGVPLILLERERNWTYFLDHGYFTPPGIAEPIIDVDRMDRSQAEALCLFLESDASSRSSDALNRLQHLLKRGRHSLRPSEAGSR